MTRPATSDGKGNYPPRHKIESFTVPNLLLVEGDDEYNFFRFLYPRDDVQIHVYNGKDHLKLDLQTIQGIDGYDQIKRVAIVRDADRDPQAALQSVLSQWANALKEPLPQVVSDRWFDDSKGRQWSVWIMPDPETNGDLEELLWRAVEASEHRSCVEELVICLDTCDLVPFRSRTKARLYSWLSTQRDPVNELHAAFKSKRGLFQQDHAAFSRFLTLVKEM